MAKNAKAIAITAIPITVDGTNFDGNSDNEYNSAGNKSCPVTNWKNFLIGSIYIAIITPNTVPKVAPITPIDVPDKMNIFIIDLRDTPNVRNTAISLFLSLTNITNEEIMLNAATITININIKNITLDSTCNAPTNPRFKSRQSRTIKPSGNNDANALTTVSLCSASVKNKSICVTEFSIFKYFCAVLNGINI